jgi:hypothetical protein
MDNRTRVIQGPKKGLSGLLVSAGGECPYPPSRFPARRVAGDPTVERFLGEWSLLVLAKLYTLP